MIILGLDPGLRRTGFAAIRINPDTPSAPPSLLDAGVISLKPAQPVAERLHELHTDLAPIIAEHTPAAAAVEKIYAHYKHPATAAVMGHARGVILLALQSAAIPILELPATEIKKSVTGHGHASKQQIAHAVRAILALPQPPHPADVADAAAIAITAARRIQTNA